jgi:hypothetical protein
VIKPVVLLEKRPDNKNKDELTPFQYGGKAWKDGTIKSDIPTKQLTKIHNAHFFLVCQVNPHATPFFFNARGAGGVPTSKRGNEHYRGGFLMALMEKFLKLEVRVCVPVRVHVHVLYCADMHIHTITHSHSSTHTRAHAYIDEEVAHAHRRAGPAPCHVWDLLAVLIHTGPDRYHPCACVA